MSKYARKVIFKPYRAVPGDSGGGPRFTLTIWDDLGWTSDGKLRLRYTLEMSDKKRRTMLFAGSDFATPKASDSDETVHALMNFLTARPGDTDAEYFAGYTEDQLNFCTDHAEALAMEVLRRFGEIS